MTGEVLQLREVVHLPSVDIVDRCTFPNDLQLTFHLHHTRYARKGIFCCPGSGDGCSHHSRQHAVPFHLGLCRSGNLYLLKHHAFKKRVFLDVSISVCLWENR